MRMSLLGDWRFEVITVPLIRHLGVLVNLYTESVTKPARPYLDTISTKPSSNHLLF